MSRNSFIGWPNGVCDRHNGIARVILSSRPQDVAATIERFGRGVIPRFA